MKWFLKCINQYADFSTRARRSEYWYFTLFNGIFGFIAGFIAGMLATMLDMPWLVYVSYLYWLPLFIPGLAVCVRRLHDVGKSGWFYLIGFIPVVGWIWLIVLFCSDSQPGANKWGPNPKEA